MCSRAKPGESPLQPLEVTASRWGGGRAGDLCLGLGKVTPLQGCSLHQHLISGPIRDLEAALRGLQVT